MGEALFKPDRRAVIDVGTNSVKLLVADVAGREVRPVLEESRQTRLGQGFYTAHELNPARIAQTAEAVAYFEARAREHQAGYVRVIATSAAREAVNSDQLLSCIQQASGLKVEVLSGEAEASLAFQGVATDPNLVGRPLLQLDIGGGSTQFILGVSKQPIFLRSFPVGSVRLLEQFPHSDPPKQSELAACRSWLQIYMREEIGPRVEPELKRAASLLSDPHAQFQLVGTGGTASILGCMEARLEHFDRAVLEAARLSLDRIQWHVQNLWSIKLENRKQIIGLPKNRADVILTGAAIVEAIMKELHFAELRISTRGLRFGAVANVA